MVRFGKGEGEGGVHEHVACRRKHFASFNRSVRTPSWAQLHNVP